MPIVYGGSGNELVSINQNGARLVKDISKGLKSSIIRIYFEFNGQLYFNAKDSDGEQALWRTNGKITEPFLDYDAEGLEGYEIENALATDSFFVLILKNKSLAPERAIWLSNGKKTELKFLSDLLGTEKIGDFSAIGVNLGEIYFRAFKDGSGVEPYVLTKEFKLNKVQELAEGSLGSMPSDLIVLNENKRIIFTHDAQYNLNLFSKNKNQSEYQSYFKLSATGLTGIYHDSHVFNNQIYFIAGKDSAKNLIWKTDGTAAGTKLLYPTDVDPEARINRSIVGKTSEHLFFCSIKTQDQNCELSAINMSDETIKLFKHSDQIVLLSTIYPIENTNLAVFAAQSDKYGAELYVTDGTPSGTKLLKDILIGSAHSFPRNFHYSSAGKLRFVVTTRFGYALYETDGTSSGTKQLIPINVESTSGSKIANPIKLENRDLVFRATSCTRQYEVFHFDKKKGEIRPVLGEGVTSKPGTFSSIIGEVNEKIVFQTTLPEFGSELWTYNGVAAKLLMDIVPGEQGAFPALIGKVKNKILVSTQESTPTSTRAIWSTDGTSEGTIKLDNLVSNLTNIGEGVSLNGDQLALFFLANTKISNQDFFELWSTDGTRQGSKLIKRIEKISNLNGEFFSRPIAFKNKILFDVTTSTYKKNELWVSDGSELGTYKLTDFLALSSYSDSIVNGFAVANNLFYLLVNNDDNQLEIIETDGTLENTKKSMAFENYQLTSSNILSINNNLLTSVKVGELGAKLVGFNGTDYFDLLEVSPSSEQSEQAKIYNFSRLEEQLFFNVKNANGAIEFWKTDGTKSGTRLLIKSNYPNSRYTVIDSLNNKQIVLYNGEKYGEEPYIMSSKEEPPKDFCPNDPNKTFPGVCGCGEPDVDSDNDGILNCLDTCPNKNNTEARTSPCDCLVSPKDLNKNDIKDCETLSELDYFIKLAIKTIRTTSNAKQGTLSKIRGYLLEIEGISKEGSNFYLQLKSAVYLNRIKDLRRNFKKYSKSLKDNQQDYLLKSKKLIRVLKKIRKEKAGA